MKISAQIAVVMAAIFAMVCFGVAVWGFSAIGEMTDPQQIADSKGYAMFWAFLGFVAVIMGPYPCGWCGRTRIAKMPECTKPAALFLAVIPASPPTK